MTLMFEPTETGYLWTTGVGSQRSPSKVGAIPTAYPLDHAKAWASCTGCALRDGKRRMRVTDAQKQEAREKAQCYYWQGRHSLTQPRLVAAYEKGKPYSLTHALAGRLKSARAVRMSQGGDPSACNPGVYDGMRDAVKREGLAWLDYTHFWRSRSKGAWLRGKAMASADNWRDALRAVKAGWRATVHASKLPHKGRMQGTYRGVRYTLCPAQRPGKKVTCNDCRLCDASAKAVPVIVFINH